MNPEGDDPQCDYCYFGHRPRVSEVKIKRLLELIENELPEDLGFMLVVVPTAVPGDQETPETLYMGNGDRKDAVTFLEQFVPALKETTEEDFNETD